MTAKAGMSIRPGRPKIKRPRPPYGSTRVVDCPSCDGTGRLKVRQDTLDGGHRDVELKCIRCGGTGKWWE